MSPVFIWQTDPTWLRPSAQQEPRIHMSSTCCARVGNQSETQMPLLPYCLKVRFDRIRELEAVPMAVMGRPKDEGMGWPLSLSSSGLGSKRSMWLGPPSMKSQMTDLALGGKCGF